MEDGNDFIKRTFHCKICDKNHKVKLKKNLIEGRTKFPFPFIFLHDHINGVEHKEILTILYIDKNLQIRHSEMQELDYDSLFSKEQVIAMMRPLLEEINILRTEVETLTTKLNTYKNN